MCDTVYQLNGKNTKVFTKFSTQKFLHGKASLVGILAQKFEAFRTPLFTINIMRGGLSYGIPEVATLFEVFTPSAKGWRLANILVWNLCLATAVHKFLRAHVFRVK